MQTGVGQITVTSEPSDADVYINDKFVGKTPANGVAFSYQYKTWRQPLGLGYTGPEVAGTYVIKVSKNEYKDAFENICIDYLSTSYFTAECLLKKKDYHFILERNPQTTNEGSLNETSKAGEIEKYKQLMDKGTITKEEFELKKNNC